MVAGLKKVASCYRRLSMLDREPFFLVKGTCARTGAGSYLVSGGLRILCTRMVRVVVSDL